MIKTVIYEDSGRQTRDFQVRSKKDGKGFTTNHEDEAEVVRFIKTVDYKCSFYREE